MSDTPELDGLDVATPWRSGDEHPGEQCHEVHPGEPHRTMTLPPDDPNHWTSRAGREPASDPAALVLGTDPWTRFDMWADRAWEFMGQALAAAAIEGERNVATQLESDVRYDPRASTLADAAHLAADLARAACPIGALGMGLPPETPMPAMLQIRPAH